MAKSLLKDAEHLGREDDEGSVEYKWKLVGITEDRFEHLCTQMKFRLNEGQGECMYELGVDDSGLPKGLDDADFTETLGTLKRMAEKLQADVAVVCEKVVNEDPVMKCAEVMVRKFGVDNIVDMRIVLLGHVGSGKSTTVGVLTRGVLDSGSGSARQNVFNHRHEVETGRTSSISREIMGFDCRGEVVNYKCDSQFGNVTSEKISELSSKVVTFYDLAGHEKYLKTTVTGMTGSTPDYSCVMVAADKGMQQMTKEHIGLCLALKIPFFCVITRVDKADTEMLTSTVQGISTVLQLPGVRRVPLLVKSEDDAIACAKQLKSAPITPLFCISNVTGECLPLVRKFLNLLPIRRDWEALAQGNSEVFIEKAFHQVEGVGTVGAGVVEQGVICRGDSMFVGPTEDSKFAIIQVKSLQVNRTNMKKVEAGSHASFAFECDEEGLGVLNSLRKGMVLLDIKSGPSPMAYWRFEADITVLYASTSGIQSGFQPIMHVHMTRQKVRITLEQENQILKTNDTAHVTFEFLFQPEWLKVGQKLVFMEGCIKGVGTVTKLVHVSSPPVVPRNRKQSSSSDSKGTPKQKARRRESPIPSPMLLPADTIGAPPLPAPTKVQTAPAAPPEQPPQLVPQSAGAFSDSNILDMLAAMDEEPTEEDAGLALYGD
eukprot:TRINITY_DN66264_c3_g3_i1.p1 TRINITY_DN66264_c3_g3~~TRINITY_DN66264_c3_g3_i1.p1  ORF type:complete len:657 (-),score=57.62 TRINITY_DN66264_c3_g3_i1:165-2135(-)